MLFDVKTVVQNELPKAAYPIDKTVSHGMCFVILFLLKFYAFSMFRNYYSQIIHFKAMILMLF